MLEANLGRCDQSGLIAHKIKEILAPHGFTFDYIDDEGNLIKGAHVWDAEIKFFPETGEYGFRFRASPRISTEAMTNIRGDYAAS